MNTSQEARLQLPPHMPPALALDVGLCMTGHVKETGLVRYMALALLYLSWHFDEPASFDVYQIGLQEFPDDDGPTLLDNLAHPPAYSRRGDTLALSRLAVKTAQKAALQWKGQLTRPGLSPLRLHLRALEIFGHVISMERESTQGPEGLMLFKALERTLISHSSTGSRPPMDGFEFGDAVSALEFMMMKLHERAPAPDAAQTALKASTAQGLQIFNPLDAGTVLRKLPASNGQEGNGQQRHVLESMARSTGFKGLVEVPAGAPLAELYTRFPHFEKPLDFIASALALAACGEEGQPVRFPPILLKGLPGTGKTFFGQELARVLGTGFVERDLSVTSEAFVLTGLDAGWKNSKPGLIFDALVSGTSANPIICLNEVDKCRADGSHSSPIASLYALLEPTSSRTFTDEFIPVTIDASRIVWVLTANDGSVPEPILSRLEVFNIEPPSPEQCRAIAKSVWAEVLSKHMPKGHGFPPELSEEILECISSLSPRLMRKALLHAAGAAALKSQKNISAPDLARGMARYMNDSSKRSIGFSATF